MYPCIYPETNSSFIFKNVDLSPNSVIIGPIQFVSEIASETNHMGNFTYYRV